MNPKSETTEADTCGAGSVTDSRSSEPSSKRNRWLARSPAPPRFVLTERDVDIILACYEHQGLTRSQVQRAVGIPGVTRANQRLKVLWEHHFLERLLVGTPGTSCQPLYVAGRAAVPVIASRTVQPATQVRSHIREDARRSLLVHDAQLNDARIALTLAIQGDAGMTLNLWHNPRETYDAFAPGRALRPDGYVRFTADGLVHAVFIELDRGTVTLQTRWQSKAASYVEYRESGAYTAKYHLERFRVLVFAPSRPRLENLRAATRAVTDKGFLFALASDVLADADPRRMIWLSLADDRPRALVEPVGGP